MPVAPAHRFFWAVALALVIAGTSREGRARTTSIATRLNYEVAPGCPTVDSFEALVTQRLGYPTFRADAPTLVVVRIEPAGRTLEGRLEWRSQTGATIGEQTFPSKTGDCTELARAMGFALALQIQLMAATAAEPPAAPPPSPPAPQLQSAAVPPPDRRAQPEGPWVLAGAGGFVALGLSSGATGGGRLFAAAHWPHVALELGGELSLPAVTHRSDGAGFSQDEFLAVLAACGVQFRWSLCAVGKVGAFRVTGQSVDVPLTATGLMLQTGVRLAFSQGFGHRTYVIVQAEGLSRLTQGTVTLDSMPVWTTPRFAALLGINLAVRFH